MEAAVEFWKPGTLTSVFFAAITYNLPGAALTAEELLTLCKEPVSQGYCEGYVAGFYDGRTTSDYGQLALRSCPPSDSTGDRLAVSYTQMVRVFTKVQRSSAH